MKKLNHLMFFCLLCGSVNFVSAEDAKPIASNNASSVVVDLGDEADTPCSSKPLNLVQESLINTVRGDHLTGNWAGMRPKLAEKGLEFNISYLANLAGNPFGGKGQGTTTTNSVNLGFSLDLGALTNMSALAGWKLNNTWVWRTGESLTKNFIDNQFNVQQNFGAQTIKLQALNISKSQNLLDDALIASMKTGRFAAGDDFMQKSIYGLYMNNAIDGNPVGVFNQTKWSAYPGSTWAAMGELRTCEGQYFRSGIYQINSDVQDSNDRHGMDFSFEEGIGVNVNNEIGWDINHNDSGQSPGNVSFGVVSDWYDAPRVDDSGLTDPYNTSFYWQADYMLWNMGQTRRDGPTALHTAPGESYKTLRGLTPWFVVQFDPYDNLATLPLFINGGVTFNAPLECRPDDALSFGGAWGGYSDRLTGRERGMSEMMFELNYKAQLTRFLFVQPVAEYIVNPKGGEYPDALVLGMQLGMNF